MEIHLTPEQESELSRLAVLEGKGEVELAREVLSRALAAEAHFVSAVNTGREAALRGDFVEQSEVWAGVEGVLKA
jgi:predicted transcriptional regulator